MVYGSAKASLCVRALDLMACGDFLLIRYPILGSSIGGDAFRFVLFFVVLLDEPFGGEPVERRVERAGQQADPPLGQHPDLLHDAVPCRGPSASAVRMTNVGVRMFFTARTICK